MLYSSNKNYLLLVVALLTVIIATAYQCTTQKVMAPSMDYFQYEVTSNSLQKLTLNITSHETYANLSLVVGNKVLLDNLAIPDKGTYQMEVLVDFQTTGVKQLQWQKSGGKMTIEKYEFTEVNDLVLPSFKDVSMEVGLITEPSWKYGGPTVADIDQNGYYDLILNNHDKISTQLFLQKEKGQFVEQTLFPFIADFHGTAAGDYDRDGDLDIINSRGGGNGTTPNPPYLARNDEGVFTEVSAEVGITTGARGRAVRWIDMDLDGDLDLMAINAEGINATDSIQHLFYENNGKGQFTTKRCAGLENAEGERVLITDLNNDFIDDVVLYTPLSIWLGNGDFSYTNVSDQWLGTNRTPIDQINAITDIDLDNDGDLDLYLARGKTHYQIANKSVDFNPQTGRLDLRDEGNKAITRLEFEAEGNIKLSDGFLWYRLYYGGFPFHLGKQKDTVRIGETSKGEAYGLSDLVVTPEMAKGWSEERSENGWYLGYLGQQKWRLEWVRNKPIYWGIRLSISGIKSWQPIDWQPNNRNVQDILLENKGGQFQDVSEQWQIPKGGNHWGVTVADFNNDSHQDLFVYRFGGLKSRVADWLLLNTGKGNFIPTTTHTAHDMGDQGHGDMGQAFDYDSDGQVDMLNGSDDYGKWYLYANKNSQNNHVLVRVGTSPTEKIDPYSAVVTVVTESGTFQKRVGSAGEVHSQSLLNTVHFGLGQTAQITSITVRWLNGEEKMMERLRVNQIYDFSSN